MIQHEDGDRPEEKSTTISKGYQKVFTLSPHTCLPCSRTTQPARGNALNEYHLTMAGLFTASCAGTTSCRPSWMLINVALCAAVCRAKNNFAKLPKDLMAELPWVKEARRFIVKREIKDKENNLQIEQRLKVLNMAGLRAIRRPGVRRSRAQCSKTCRFSLHLVELEKPTSKGTY